MPAPRRALHFFGLNRNTTALLTTILLIAAGEEMWMRFLPKYLEVLGASVLIIGVYDALKTILGAVYAYPGGIATDRWGHRPALGFFTILSMVGYALVFVFPHWAAVLAAMFLFLAWTTLSLPATFTLVGRSLPENKHAMGIGLQSFTRRIPVIVGPLAGGILIDRYGIVSGIRIGVVVSIMLGMAALLLQRRIEVDAGSAKRHVALREVLKRADRRFRRLLFSDILIRCCERLPFAWVVIHVMNNLGATATEVGLLTAVEVATAMMCFIPTSYLADRYGKEPFVIVTFIFFTLFPVALALTEGFSMLVLAFVVRGLKEFGEPARKALILAYAPSVAKAQAVGAYYLIRDSIVSVASLLGAALWALGPQVNFWTAAGFGAAGTIVYLATMGKSGIENR